MRRSFEPHLSEEETGSSRWHTQNSADGREIAYFARPAKGWRVLRQIAKLRRET